MMDLTLGVPYSLYNGGFSDLYDHILNGRQFFNEEVHYDFYVAMIVLQRLSITVSVYLGMIMNSMIFIDLYLTLRNPFYPRKRRNFYYLAIGFLLIQFVAWSVIYEIFYVGPRGYLLNDGGEILIKYKRFIYIILAMNLIPSFLVLLRLRKEGTSRELK
jgi:uncharacterized membrane protein